MDCTFLSGTVGGGTGAFGVNPSSVYYNLFLNPDSGFNPEKWVDSAATAMYQKGTTAANPGPDWLAMTSQLTQDGFTVPVYAPEDLYYVTKGIGGVVFPVSAGNIGQGAPPYIANIYPES